MDAGCTIEVPLDVMFWGDRWGRLKDPFGIAWAMNAPVKPQHPFDETPADGCASFRRLSVTRWRKR